jgi:A/G-specific adenine glycosylase
VLRAEPMAAAWRQAGKVHHVFTHFELHLDVLAAQVDRIAADGFLRHRAALADEALPSVMRKAVAVAQGAPA